MSRTYSSAPNPNYQRPHTPPSLAPLDENQVLNVDFNGILSNRALNIARSNGIDEASVSRVYHDTCSICFADLKAHDAPPRSVKILCGHVFCMECINLSSRHGNNCPNCRKPGPTLELESGLLNDVMVPQVDVSMAAAVAPAIGRLSSVISRGNLRNRYRTHSENTTSFIPNQVLPPRERIVVPTSEPTSVVAATFKLINNGTKSVLICITSSNSSNVDHFMVLDCSGSMYDSYPILTKTVKNTVKKMGNSRISVNVFDDLSYHIIPLMSYNMTNYEQIESTLNSANMGGGTQIDRGLQHLVEILKSSGYDPENPRDTSELKICIMTDGDTRGLTEAVSYYKELAKIVEHFDGRIKFCSFGSYTNLDQIQVIMGEKYNEDFDQCTDTSHLERVLTESSANVVVKDMNIFLPEGSTFLTGSSYGERTKEIPEMCSGQFLELLIDGVPESVCINFIDNDDPVHIEIETVIDDTGLVDKIVLAKDIKMKLTNYMNHINEASDSMAVCRSVLREMKELIPMINEQRLGHNAYYEINDLYKAIEAEAQSHTCSSYRADSHHLFQSQVARTRSCERRGGGEVMSQR